MFRRLLLLGVNLFEKPFEEQKVILNRYRILRFLGRGSYGNSYLVHDAKTDQDIVLKSLRWHKRRTKAAHECFLYEQHVLQSVAYPYFPNLYENGVTEEGIPFYTMEYINGKTFEELIFTDGETYSEKEAFQIASQLLTIIEFIHRRGIVHRDIRIPNVMMVDGQLKLIDFGLARRIDNLECGSVESIKRQKAPVSDFYALGHFLLFLLYSQYEFTDHEKEKSWEEELVLSVKARTIIRKLLAIDDPYRSCAEIEQDFNSIYGDGGNERVIF